MSSFAFLLLCVQACLIQSVFSSCAGRITPYGSGLTSNYGSSLGLGAGLGSNCGAGLGAINLGANATPAVTNSYGGVGNGEVFVLGDLPINGATAVSGQVPVVGLVQFNGPVPAYGSVSISGSCGCGCGSY